MNAITTTMKSAAYCYPSSPMATELGYGKTGCWVVYTVECLDNFFDMHERSNLQSFVDESAARIAFDAIDLPIQRSTSKFR